MKYLNSILLSLLIALTLLISVDCDTASSTDRFYGRDGFPSRRVGGGSR